MAGLVPEPPVATAVPQVNGTPRRGRPIAANVGSWRNGPLAYGYRWQRERRDSPWYPAMTLFRPSRPDDWAGVLGDVAEALAAVVEDRGRLGHRRRGL